MQPSNGSGDDRRPAAFGVSIAIFVTASLFVGLSFTTKLLIVKRVRQSDYWMILAWVIDFGLTFSFLYALSNGLGLHEVDISPANRPSMNRAAYAFTVLYNPALMTVKTAILVFYLTFMKEERGYRLGTYATLFVVNTAGLALTLVNIFQCYPVHAAFDINDSPTDSCIDIIALYLCSIPVNIVTDIAILCLPMPILTKVRLPRRQKMTLVVIFGCGVFVTVIDVVRIIYLQSAARLNADGLNTIQIHIQNGKDIDLSWYSSLSLMWAVVEVNMSIICGCAPGLKPLVSHIIPKWIKSTDSLSKHSVHVQGQSDHSTSQDTAPPCLSGQTKRSKAGSEDIALGDLCHSSGYQTSHDGPEPPVFMMPSLTVGPSANTESLALTSQVSRAQPVLMNDFIQFRKERSMLKLSNKESLAPIALVTIIYWLWGFSYGLILTLGTQLQGVLKINEWKVLGIHAAYYGGYSISPLLIGRVILKKWGYTSSLITGLFIYAVGALIFWPSAVLTSFPAFTVSALVVGAGLGILETSADSFLALCGPLENSEIRLNASQSIQAVATVVSTLLAKKILFRNIDNGPSLVNVQWTYLSIAFFNVILAAVVFYLSVPELPDEDLEELVNLRRDDLCKRVCGLPVVWVTFFLGVLSLYLYVAGQEVLAMSFEPLVLASHAKTTISPADLTTIAQSMFAIGRFLTAITLIFLKPRHLLLLAYTGMIIFSVLAMKTTGTTALSAAMLVYLFESGVFGTTFATSLRGMGRHTKTASTLLATAISGGAFLPFAGYALSLSRGVQFSYCVLVAVVAAGALFPLYLNFVPAASVQVDPVRNEYIMRRRRKGSGRTVPSRRSDG